MGFVLYATEVAEIDAIYVFFFYISSSNFDASRYANDSALLWALGSV